MSSGRSISSRSQSLLILFASSASKAKKTALASSRPSVCVYLIERSDAACTPETRTRAIGSLGLGPGVFCIEDDRDVA